MVTTESESTSHRGMGRGERAARAMNVRAVVANPYYEFQVMQIDTSGRKALYHYIPRR